MAADTDGPLRVLVATDMHLGAHEADEVRRDDSFRALREVLALAHTHVCDAILLGGDLFHENSPSRHTLLQAMRSLSAFVLGPGNVTVKVVSDSSVDFPSAGSANFESEHHNVQLPVFTIHGNHDDPSGPDGSSALDVLSNARLINYFGRHDVFGGLRRQSTNGNNAAATATGTSTHNEEYEHEDSEDGTEDISIRSRAQHRSQAAATRRNQRASQAQFHPGQGGDALRCTSGDDEYTSVGSIAVRPVLLEKGNARLALYGLGHMRDARLKAIFERPDGVQVKPPPGSDQRPSSSWVNAMLVHQNRSEYSPNALPESYLPSFMDLTIWGHEHECKLGDNPSAIQPSDGGGRVFQVGSTVQTSLEEGEAIQKKVGLLEVAQTGRWRMRALPLTTVRQFMFEKVTLAHEDELDRAADLDQMAKDIDNLLDRRVRSLVQRAYEERREEQPELPLVRLRVDYTGFTTINTRKFGQRFVRSVANPHDLLAFSKSSARGNRAAHPYVDRKDEEVEPPDIIEGREEANQAQIEEFLSEQLGNLHVLQSDYLKSALDGFVNKNDRTAIDNTVKSALKDIRGRLMSSSGATFEDADIDTRLRAANENRPGAAEYIVNEQNAEKAERNDTEEDDDVAGTNPGEQSTLDNMLSAAAASRQQHRSGTNQYETQRRKRNEAEEQGRKQQRKRQRQSQAQSQAHDKAPSWRRSTQRNPSENAGAWANIRPAS